MISLRISGSPCGRSTGSSDGIGSRAAPAARCSCAFRATRRAWSRFGANPPARRRQCRPRGSTRLRRFQFSPAKNCSSLRGAKGSTRRERRSRVSHQGAGFGRSTSSTGTIGAGRCFRRRMPWRACSMSWIAVHRARSPQATPAPRDTCASSCVRHRRTPERRSTRRFSHARFGTCRRANGVCCSWRCPGRWPIRRSSVRARRSSTRARRYSPRRSSQTRRGAQSPRCADGRVDGTGPVFLRIERAVRYARVDVDRWLGERLVR